jgi:uncharacterized protein YdcH (DUF465 family)
MSHTPHELAAEFPEDVTRIHDLKASNPHFAKLAGEHHNLSREIHRIETNIAPASDQALAELKKKRLAILDEVKTILAA